MQNSFFLVLLIKVLVLFLAFIKTKSIFNLTLFSLAFFVFFQR